MRAGLEMQIGVLRRRSGHVHQTKTPVYLPSDACVVSWLHLMAKRGNPCSHAACQPPALSFSSNNIPRP